MSNSKVNGLQIIINIQTVLLIYIYIFRFFAAGIDLNIFEKRYNFDWNIIDLKINYLRKRKVTQSINYRMFASKSLNSVLYF